MHYHRIPKARASRKEMEARKLLISTGHACMRCTYCGEPKRLGGPNSDFYMNKSTRNYYTSCKECRKAITKERYNKKIRPYTSGKPGAKPGKREFGNHANFRNVLAPEQQEKMLTFLVLFDRFGRKTHVNNVKPDVMRFINAYIDNIMHDKDLLINNSL